MACPSNAPAYVGTRNFSPYGHALTGAGNGRSFDEGGQHQRRLRTMHYNHSARFLELCDAAGFLCAR